MSRRIPLNRAPPKRHELPVFGNRIPALYNIANGPNRTTLLCKRTLLDRVGPQNASKEKMFVTSFSSGATPTPLLLLADVVTGNSTGQS